MSYQSDSKESLQGEGGQVSPIVRLALANMTTTVSQLPLHPETSPADLAEDTGCSQLLNLPLCKTGSMKHMCIGVK